LETSLKQHTPWGIKSASYWITLLVALAIIFIGARFMLQPMVAAVGYGIPFNDAHDAAYGRIKGIRDIFSGLVLLPLLLFKMRKAAAWVFTTAILVPAVDFLIIAFTNGSGDLEHLLVHGLTAVLMIVNSYLLFNTCGKTKHVR
jgi:hypothetical protein